jgi:uncharacterized membrane protein
MMHATAPHFRNAWRIFQSSPRVFVSAMLCLFASWVALEIAVVLLYRLGFAVWLILHLAWLFFFGGLMVGIHRVALKAVDGEAPRLSVLFHSFKDGPAYMFAVALYSFGVLVGLLLFVVPGVYLAVRCFLFAQILADESGSAFRALRRSALLTVDRWSAVGGLFARVFLLNLAGVAFLGIGLLITFPVSLLAISGLYRSIPQPAL